MKQLLGGIALIVLIGIAGFFYRNAIERPGLPQQACTMEAKLCPDGAAVGRSGPACAFAPCPPPNVENQELDVAFALPEGYVYSADRALYEKPSLSSSVPHTIAIHRFPIPEGQTAEQVIIENTTFYPADMPAESLERFEQKVIGDRTYYVVVIERFEALVNSRYYLPREKDVLAFEIVEHDVTEWMNPDLVVAQLPEHQALIRMLETLQTPQ